MINIDYVPAFEDNYIWLATGTDSTRCLVVDPGDAEPVFAALAERGQTPAAILITHHHGDHTGGAAELAARFDCPVYGPAGERIAAVDLPLREGDEVSVAGTGLRFRVLDTPGHTRGHICYVGHAALFCGDTLFTAGCGRLFEGTAEQMHASLGKLAALDPDTAVYCAHEYTLASLKFAAIADPDNPEVAVWLEEARARRARGEATVPSTIGRERAANPFLRGPQLRAAAEAHLGRRLAAGAETFAALRAWKDEVDRGG